MKRTLFDSCCGKAVILALLALGTVSADSPLRSNLKLKALPQNAFA